MTGVQTCALPISLVVDFNDENVIGRARLHWNEEHDTLLADLFIDKAVPFLCNPPEVLVATQDTDVFTSEGDGVTYAVNGYMSQVSILTYEGHSDFYGMPVYDEPGTVVEGVAA